MNAEQDCVCVAGVLSPANRLTRSADFGSAVRDGRRLRSGTLVVHVTAGGSATPRVGFVVSKAVGNSVVRHRVARRLRAGVRTRLHTLPTGSDTVVRALPAAADATSARLVQDFDRALRSLERPHRATGRS